MKTKVFFWLLAGLMLVSGSAVHAGPYHHGGHWGGGYGYHSYPRFGFYLGLPLYPRSYYSYPYYPPAIMTVPSSPPVYIEKPAPQTMQQQFQSGYWYYCNNPEGYYPYVTDCPAGWRQVDPIPQR